ncbi:MAG: porphobilinogen synthase, partial [Bacteroidota bacterium]
MNHRPRRNRKSAGIRAMVRETRVDLDQLIFPLFMADGTGIRHEVQSMPGMFRLSQDLLLKEMEECMELGIQSFALFPSFEESQKDSHATLSHNADNYYLKFISDTKKHFPEVVLMSDVAMDPYSSDGHDGIVVDGEIVNDPTLDVLAKMAVAQAQAGIDIIGPSDMMDGRVGHIREELDLNGFSQVSIMSYTAKYASGFYGPFRDALDSAPKAGDKKTYQMDPANRREALREAALDLSEGADMLMV